MVPSFVMSLLLLGSPGVQDPFRPLDFNQAQGVPTRAGAREEWARITNRRLELANKTLRVAADGFTAVVLAPDVTRPRHAKPILLGKGEHELLFKSIAGLGFTRIVVRNPSGKEWAARLEKGKAILE